MSKPPWTYQTQGISVVLLPLPDRCWVIQTWQGVSEANPVQQQLFLQGLKQELGQAETLMLDDHRCAKILAWILEQGFQPLRRKFLYEKQLEPGVSFPDCDLHWQSLADLGQAAFLDYLTQAAHQDPEASAATSPEQEFAELLAHAGSAFDPSHWWVAFSGAHEAIGVVLPQVFPDKPTEGTLSYVGVLPRFRQQGYGALLHQWGLAALAQRGVLRYIGSTGHTNRGMQRVFQRNACTLLATRYFLRPAERA